MLAQNQILICNKHYIRPVIRLYYAYSSDQEYFCRSTDRFMSFLGFGCIIWFDFRIIFSSTMLLSATWQLKIFIAYVSPDKLEQYD